MALPILSDVALIPSFDVGNDINSMGQRWTRWLRSFNLYATGKGVVDLAQKKALLLHSAGMEVQDMYFTLQERDPGEGETVYDCSSRNTEQSFHTTNKHVISKKITVPCYGTDGLKNC